MLLDFNPSNGLFFLRIGRAEGGDMITTLQREHGFDFSSTASTADTAVLFSNEPYAAASFAEDATPTAYAQIAPLVREIGKSWADTNSGVYAVPMDQELWDFQKASLAYALERRNTLIGDQPGLGKTPIAIAFANEIRAQRILVICPANIRLQWAKKIQEWTTLPWPYSIYPILRGSSGVHPTANWTVVSYDLARSEGIGSALAKGHYDLVILDEAHYLKTSDSDRTRAIFGGGRNRTFAPIAQGAERVLALTGTPLPNRPREAYTLARALCFDAIDFMSEDKFRSRFNPSQRIEIVGRDGRTKFAVDERTGRHSELQNRLRANLMVRHLKRDVMPQLKLPMYDIVDMEETQAVKRALEAESLLGIDPDNLEDIDFIHGHIAAVRRQMGVALAPQVADYCKMLLDGGEDKLVVFGWHIDVLNILQYKLEKYGVLRIDGSTSATQKMERVKQFRLIPQKRVMLGNLLSLGTGTDGLQDVCNHAVFAEPDWVSGNNEQAVDRLDRGGQVRTVLADFCVAPRSIGARILSRALEKRRTVHKALDTREKVVYNW